MTSYFVHSLNMSCGFQWIVFMLGFVNHMQYALEILANKVLYNMSIIYQSIFPIHPSITQLCVWGLHTFPTAKRCRFPALQSHVCVVCWTRLDSSLETTWLEFSASVGDRLRISGLVDVYLFTVTYSISSACQVLLMCISSRLPIALAQGVFLRWCC